MLCMSRANASILSLIVPRYLFRFSSGKEFVPDNVGTELPNLKAAHLHAVELIDKTVRFMSDVSPTRSLRCHKFILDARVLMKVHHSVTNLLSYKLYTSSLSYRTGS